MKRNAFTLIELLIVIVILAILAAVGVTTFRGVTSDARDAKKKADVQALANAFEKGYDGGKGIYPAGVDYTGSDTTKVSKLDFTGGEVPKAPDGQEYYIQMSTDNKSFAVCALLKDNTTFCKQSTNGPELISSITPTTLTSADGGKGQGGTTDATSGSGAGASPTAAPTPTPTPTPTPALNITTGLMAYWKMDDNVSGNNKSLIDSSGNGNTGTTYYGTNFAGMDCTVTGKYGKGCSFDGVDDYVNIGSYIGPSELTIAAWVKINNMPAQGPYLIAGAINTFELQLWGGGINRFILGVATKNNVWQAGMGYTQMPFQVTTGTWYHVVSTYTPGVTKIYIDGQERGISTSTTGNILSNGSTVNIGKRSVYFNGQIDEVRIYDHALTPEQIDYLYHFVP